jgi:cobalt-zinc-cadmium efflux system outer membrane protein
MGFVLLYKIWRRLMCKILKYLILFVCLLTYQMAEAETISLSTTMNVGIVNNPTLKASRARLGISDAQILQANMLLNPVLMSDNGIAEKTYRLGIEQTIELGGKRHKRTKLAKINKEATETEILTTLLDVRSNIRSSYIQLYKAQQELIASQEILDTTQKLSEIAKKREQAGDIAKLDVLQAEITMVKAKSDIQTSKLNVNQSFNNLCANLGSDLDRTLVLEKPVLYDEFNGVSNKDENFVNNLVEIAYKSRPEIKTLEKNIEAQEMSLKIAKANIVPNLTVAVGPDLVTEGGNKTSVFAMANMEIPLFNRQQGNIKEILAQKEVYEQELVAQKTKITQEVKNAWAGIVNNAESIKIYENEIIPKAKEVLNKSNMSFKEGKSNILTSLNAQEAYINTKFGYIQVVTDYENSLSDLERALGVNKGDNDL